MAEKDFVVKNGLQVNGGTWVVNSTAIYYNGNLLANSSFFSGTANTSNTANTANSANNSSYLGGVAAASYVNTSGSYTLSGNINFTGTNTYFTNGWAIGSNIVADSTSIVFGNSSVNVSINSTGFYINSAIVQASGGYYKGNAGTIGEATAKANLYRINSNTQSNNITISAGENALTAGPIVIDSGYNLVIETGGRVVIV